MAYLLIGLGVILSLVGFVGAIWILVEAFKMSVAQGFLTLCVPCYVFYFVFGLLEHPQKNTMVLLWLGGSIPGSILTNLGTAMLNQ